MAYLDADEQGRTAASADSLVGEVGRLEHESKGTLELMHALLRDKYKYLNHEGCACAKSAKKI